MLVNQPTVREGSPPNGSSRPCPSRSTGTGCPAQSPRTRPSAASSTSLTCVRYTAGTSRSSADDSSGLSRTVTERVAPTMFGAEPSTGIARSASSPRQWSSSSSKPPAVANSVNFAAHSWNDVLRGPRSIDSPRTTWWYARSRSSRRIRQDTPSTTRWCAASRRIRPDSDQHSRDSPSPIAALYWYHWSLSSYWNSIRSASWCSASADSAAVNATSPTSSVSSSSSTWSKCSGTLDVSKNQRWIGVSATSPLTGPCTGPSPVSVIDAASAAIVWWR